MGAWGAGAFENDIALDWVAETADLGAVGVTASIECAVWPPVAGVLEPDPVEQGASIIAACEAIAMALGAPGPVPDDVRRDLAPRLEGLAGTKGLADLALRGLALASDEGSALADLWGEDPETLSEWNAAVDDLRARLKAAFREDPTAWEPANSGPIAFLSLSEGDTGSEGSDVSDGGGDPTALIEQLIARVQTLEMRMDKIERGMR